MPVYNAQVAALLHELADLLEIEGKDRYRIRAYRNAARTVETLSTDLTDLVGRGEDLTALPGIGESIAVKIEEIVRSGRLRQIDEVRARLDPGLVELLGIPNLGPKRVRALYDALHVTSLAGLERAAREGRVREVAGFGPKMEANLLRDLEQHRQRLAERRLPIDEAEQVARLLSDYLGRLDGVERVDVAGSFRRRRETVGDLDVLVIASDGPALMQHLVAYPDVSEVLSRGDTRSSVRLRTGLQVDVRVVPRESYGAALVYFTGSQAHNIALRQRAQARGLKLSEYALSAQTQEGAERPADQGTLTEEGIYGALGLPWIPPEIREDRGEIRAAEQGRLPELVELGDIRGDLQAHTHASDGQASLEEMARAAQERGLEYLAITDHSQRLTVAHGLDVERLAAQMDEIDRLNDGFQGFRLLKGCEVDILEDGSLDLPDDILARLDVVICAVHSRFGLAREAQTERILRAMDNPHFGILAHPTGRLIGRREGYAVDLERVIRAAGEKGRFVEVNAQPQRLDLDDIACRMAKEHGVKVAISTDAHSAAELGYMRHGVDQARRGWLSADDVLNTRSWAALDALLHQSRAAR